MGSTSFILVSMGHLRLSAGGGFPAIAYSIKKAFESGNPIQFVQRMLSKNACKTCALGMGGQQGGMTNEMGHFPAVCKKSVQAQAGDMAGVLTESFFQQTSIEQLGMLTSRELENLGRLTFPILAESGDTHYKRISWDEALDRTAASFRKSDPKRTFFYASGRSSNEAAFLLQLVARAYGSPHINNCSYYCHQASGVALKQVYGSGTASIVLEDLEQADLAILVGANPASNHPRLMSQLVDLRKRGGKVIVINPLKELGLVRFKIPSDPVSLLFGSQIADYYVQPKVGTDIGLLKGVLKGLIEADHLDHNFIQHHTSHWKAVQEDIEATPWLAFTSHCGVSRADIDAIVSIIRNSNRGTMMWAMGLTHHAHGVDNILALTNIALSQGWLGKVGAGLLPLRGHSNIQGVGTMGVVPQLKVAFAEKLEAQFNITVPSGIGMDTYSCTDAARNGLIDTALYWGGNLYGSSPDLDWTARALQNVPFSVTVSTKLNTGHVYGRGQTAVVLPALARDEESHATTQESMFNFVRLSDGGTPAVSGEMQSEVAILSGLAHRMLPDNGFDWTALSSHQALRQAMAQVVPELEKIMDIDQTKQEFQIEGRTFHTPQFSTEDGRAHFAVTPLPNTTIDGQFQLVTLRSEGQFNTVVYEESDIYRGNAQRDVVMLAQSDASRLRLSEGDLVTVSNDTGQLTVVVSVTDISPGSAAMYYPEANVLVPRVLDKRSKTPAFKSVPVKIQPA